jgi:hypothetical protein
MGELVGKYFPKIGARCFGHSMKNFFRSHNPEHIKSPQGIERIKPLRRKRFLHLFLFLKMSQLIFLP